MLLRIQLTTLSFLLFTQKHFLIDVWSGLWIRYNTYGPWRTTSIIQTNGNHRHCFIWIPILGHVLVHSVDKTHVLVVAVELIRLLFLNIFSFNFVPTPNKSLRFTRFKKLFKSPCYRSKQPLSKLHCFFARCALFKVTTFLFLQLFVPNDSAFA